MSAESLGNRGYRVVVNGEEQYALWPSDLEIPRGWTDAGCDGTREECLDFVSRTWTDMRPRSLRERAAS